MRRLFLLVTMLFACAAPAHAQYGINLSWDDCGSNGLEWRSSLCNSNLGTQSLVVSFRSFLPLPEVVGFEAVIDVAFDDPTWSPWWDFRASIGCRSGRMVVVSDLSAEPTTCPGVFGASAIGLVSAQVGLSAPNHLRLRAISAAPTPDAVAINDTDEYTAFRLVIGNGKTTGTDACGGCSTPACMLLGSLTIFQPSGVGDYTLANPIERQSAFWQCPGAIYTSGLGCGWYCPTGNRKGTWGSVKGLYR